MLFFFPVPNFNFWNVREDKSGLHSLFELGLAHPHMSIIVAYLHKLFDLGI